MNQYTDEQVCTGCKHYHARKGNCHALGERIITIPKLGPELTKCSRKDLHCNHKFIDAVCEKITDDLEICEHCLVIRLKDKD